MGPDRRALMGAGLLAAAATGAKAQASRAALPTPMQAAKDRPDPVEVITLWPRGAPGADKVTVVEKVDPRAPPAGMRDRAVTGVRTPTLTVFRPSQPNGAAILIAPGGGYVRVVRDKEGFEAARWFAARGYTCFVLLYRLPADGWAAGPDVALQDSQRAIRLIRAGAVGYRIDPAKVMVMGFSAGGHVAGSLVTRHDDKVYDHIDAADDQPARPDLGCLVYPVIALSGELAHPGSAEAMFGKAATPAQVARTSVEAHVRATTPPCILLHAQDDTTVPVENSVVMFRAMKAAKVEAELHIFGEGQHGFGLRFVEGKPVERWPELVLAWMRRRGV